MRILKENFQALGIVVGQGLIQAFKPALQWINKALIAVTEFAESVVNALGKIFGWQIDISAGSVDYGDDISSGIDDIGDSAGKAGKAVKDLKGQLQGFDKLNVLTTPSDGSGSGGGGGGGASGGGAGGGGDVGFSIKDTVGLFESEIDNLRDLGSYISQAIGDALGSIEWEKVYEKARNFGKGLADFLNGLFATREDGGNVFSDVGKTIAGALNTAIYAAYEFLDEFDFKTFGENFASGFNDFFAGVDWQTLGMDVHKFTEGLRTTIVAFIKTMKWKDILKDVGTFLGELTPEDYATIFAAWSAAKIAKWAIGGGGLVEIIKAGIAKALVSAGGMAGIFKAALATISATGGIGLEPLANWIDENIIANILPDNIIEMIGSALAGVAAGGVAGSWLPGLGTIAGAIIGGIVGAFSATELGKKLKEKIKEGWSWVVENIGNFDTAKSTFASARESFAKAFGGEDVGKNIANGIVQGLTSLVSFIFEPIADALNALLNWLDGTEAISSMRAFADKLVENIKKFLAEKLGGVGQWINKIIFGGEYEAPSIDDGTHHEGTSGQAYTVDVTANVETKKVGDWSKFKKLTGWITGNDSDTTVTTNKTKLAKSKGWVGRSFLNWLTGGKGNSNGDTVTTNKTKLAKSKGWAGKTYLEAVTGSKSGNTNTTNTVSVKPYYGGYNSLREQVTQGYNKLSLQAKIKIDEVTVAQGVHIKGYAGRLYPNLFTGGIKVGDRWKPIPQYASGTLSAAQGELFVAREAGPELVGSIGGHAAVMNNNQIVSSVAYGVRSAVSDAMQEQNAILRSQNSILTQILAKEYGITQNDVFNAVRSENAKYVQRTGRSAFSY